MKIIKYTWMQKHWEHPSSSSKCIIVVLWNHVFLIQTWTDMLHVWWPYPFSWRRFLIEKAAEIDRGICRKIHHENSEIPKALGKGKHMDKKHPKTQERTLPDIDILKISHQAFHFCMRFSATTIAEKLLTGMQPPLFKFLGRGHHTGKNNLMSNLKCVCVWLNSIEFKRVPIWSICACQSLHAIIPWHLGKCITSSHHLQPWHPVRPTAVFVSSPWAALTNIKPSSLCSPQSMGIGVQLNQDLAESRAIFFCHAMKPITINGTTRMTTPRGFLGQNLSKKKRDSNCMAFKEVKKPYRNQIRIPFDVIQATTQKYVAEVPCLLLPAVPSHPSDPAYAGTPDNAPNTVDLYTNLAPFWDHPM